MTKSVSYAIRPDAQAFDEIRIRTVPRFKESEMSGSEWRIHAEVEFFRKGKLVHSEGCQNTQSAAGLLYAYYVRAVDNGKGYCGSDGIHCDQEGCSEKATEFFRVLKDVCSVRGGCGHSEEYDTPIFRGFCKKHEHRGDQNLDDCDSNYIRVYQESV